MNRPAIAWLQDENQVMKIIDTMAQEKIPAIRIMLLPPFERVATIIMHCNRKGIKVLLMIPLTIRDYYDEPVNLRHAKAPLYTVPPLSKLNLSLFQSKWENAINIFTEKNIEINAFQIENEFNLSVFNGDLPVQPHGTVISDKNKTEYSFWNDYKVGMGQLATISKIIHTTLRSNILYNKSTIVLGGLARPNSDWINNNGIILIEPDLALNVLTDLGINNFIDAYAIHIYPIVSEEHWQSPRSEIETYINERMKQVTNVSELSKPWWITEWGFAIRSQQIEKCGTTGDPRLNLFMAFSEILLENKWKNNFGESYIYDWDESKQFKIWNQDSVLCSSFCKVFGC